MGIQLKKADGSPISPLVNSSDITWNSKVNTSNLNWDANMDASKITWGSTKTPWANVAHPNVFTPSSHEHRWSEIGKDLCKGYSVEFDTPGTYAISYNTTIPVFYKSYTCNLKGSFTFNAISDMEDLSYATIDTDISSFNKGTILFITFSIGVEHCYASSLSYSTGTYDFSFWLPNISYGEYTPIYKSPNCKNNLFSSTLAITPRKISIKGDIDGNDRKGDGQGIIQVILVSES